MGHRYWRMVGLTTVDPAADLELSELQLYSDAGREDAAATITCPFTPAAGALADLADDDTGTTCRFAATTVRVPGFRLVWDFGASVALTGVRLGGGPVQSGFLCSLVLQYSDDGEGWARGVQLDGFDWPGAATLGAVVRFDPYYDLVRLLLHGDGPDGSTSITDSSRNPTTLLRNGSVAISTAQSVFGGASIYFGNGSGANYLQLADPSRLAFLDQDFTIEGRYYFLDGGNTGLQQMLYYNYSTDFTTGSIYYGKHPAIAGKMVFYAFSANSGAAPLLTDPVLPPDNTWVHYAVDRRGDTFKLLRDGVVVDTFSGYSGAITSTSVVDGYISTSAPAFKGYMDEVRITIGASRYGDGEAVPAVVSPNNVVGTPPLRSNLANLHLVDGAGPGDGLPTLDLSAQLRVRDLEFDGEGFIAGTIKVKGLTTDTPVHRRVRLVRDIDGALAREAWSDPATGAYRFDNIDRRYAYTVLAYDYPHSFRAVVADNIAAEAEA